MRIVVTGGGTGGHLFPGIAFATGMQDRVPGCKVMFLGTSRLLDQQTLVKYDFELESIKCMGLKGMGILGKIKSVLLLPASLLEARRIVKRFRPDLVFGVGGYVTGPVLLAARFCGVPLCIHEQNSMPGLANKLVSRFVDRIFLSIPCRYPFPDHKTKLTGNPVRREIIAAAEQHGTKESKEVALLVLGGSQGAHRVNLLVVEAAEKLAEKFGDNLRIIHQTGVTDEDLVRTRYTRSGIRAEVQPFFQDMAELYTKADLVVSRAGATTLAELAVMGLPALLIPYPYAADDHQKTNALYYVEGGAARMFIEQDLTCDQLAQEICGLLEERHQLDKMAASMKKMGKPGATQTLVDECLALIDKRKVGATA